MSLVMGYRRRSRSYHYPSHVAPTTIHPSSAIVDRSMPWRRSMLPWRPRRSVDRLVRSIGLRCHRSIYRLLSLVVGHRRSIHAIFCSCHHPSHLAPTTIRASSMPSLSLTRSLVVGHRRSIHDILLLPPSELPLLPPSGMPCRSE